MRRIALYTATGLAAIAIGLGLYGSALRVSPAGSITTYQSTRPAPEDGAGRTFEDHGGVRADVPVDDGESDGRSDSQHDGDSDDD